MLVVPDEQNLALNVLGTIRDVVGNDSSPEDCVALPRRSFVEHRQVLLQKFPGGEALSSCIVEQTELADDLDDGLHEPVASPLSFVRSRTQDQHAQDGVHSVEASVAVVGFHGNVEIQDLKGQGRNRDSILREHPHAARH